VLPAQFAQAPVIDAEVVGDLVDDGLADLAGDLLVGLADRGDRLAVNGDPVGQDPGVPGRPVGEGDALVEPKQAPPLAPLKLDLRQPPEATSTHWPPLAPLWLDLRQSVARLPSL
jgi:hypothetical protein